MTSEIAANLAGLSPSRTNNPFQAMKRAKAIPSH